MPNLGGLRRGNHDGGGMDTMTYEEIEARYGSEWVLIGSPEDAAIVL